MANDNKNPQSNNISEPTTTAAITEQSLSPQPDRHKFYKPLVIIVVIAIVVVLGIVAVNTMHIGQKVYAQAAGHKIYKKDIDNIKDGNSTISDHDAATVLADKYLTEEMAKQRHVTVDRSDINASLQQISIASGPGKNQARPSSYSSQAVINQVYFTRLAANNAGNYKGKLLVANFSRNVPYQSNLLPEKKAANPNLGNPVAIAADKKYAQDFITNLYNQIKSKKITFDQAIEIEHKDPVVGEKAYATQSHSESFNDPLSQSNLLNAKSIRNRLQTMKLHQITPPFVVKTPNSAYDQDSTAESYFLVVELDSRTGGNSGMSFQQELAQAKKQLGYKVNV